MATKVQTVSGNNGATATTSVSATLAATQSGTLLVAAICCAVNGATITPPAGWKQCAGTQATTPTGGSVALFFYDNNPGGITAVSFTITSSLAAIVISEYSGPNSDGTAYDTVGFFPGQHGTNINFGTSSNPNIPGSTSLIAELGCVAVCAVGYINNTILSISNLQYTLTEDAHNISTAASANAAIHLLSTMFFPVNQFNGNQSMTLSATPTDGPTNINATFKTFLLQLGNQNGGPSPIDSNP